MNANLAISYVDVPGFPAGSAVAAIVASITDTSLTPPTSLTQSVTPGTASVSFPNVAAGSYSFSVAAQDSTGAVLGTPVTGTFTITAPATISLSLPSVVTPTQS